MTNAVGEEGGVYLTIPATGSVKSKLPFKGKSAMEAISDDKVEIATGTRVKVVEIVSGSVLKVRTI